MKTYLTFASLGAFALVAACNSEPEAVGRDLEMKSTAEIIAVDRETRAVRMRTADGDVYQIVAGPEVRNFDQIDVGDSVVATYLQSVDLELANDAPADEVPSVSGQTATANEGTLPGKAGALTTNMIVEVIDYDEDTGIATFAGPEGKVVRAQVHPEFHEFASARKSGDRVRVTSTNLVAITVEEQ